MIVGNIILFFLRKVDLIFTWLPAVENIEVSFDMVKDIPDYVRVVLYVLPLLQLTSLFQLIMTVCTIRIVIAGVRFIKGWIPLMST